MSVISDEDGECGCGVMCCGCVDGLMYVLDVRSVVSLVLIMMNVVVVLCVARRG